MTALHQVGAPELLALYQRGALSPVEVARDVLAHIDRWEPHVKALYALDPERVLTQARESEGRWLRGEARALEGVPCTIKENIATRGIPVPLGTAATVLQPAAVDAPPAARLAEAGAVLLAKTTMPDYGMLSSGPVDLPPADPQPLGPDEEPGRQQRRRRRRGGGRLRPAAPGHRHRRLDPPAGGLVRRVRPQAQPGPHPDRPALPGPRGRADDAPRRRHRADDARAVAARRARHDEPALPADRLVCARHRRQGPAPGPADGRRLGAGRRAPDARRDRSGGTALRGRRRHRRADARLQRHARWSKAWTASGACAPGSTSAPCRASARTRCCPTSGNGSPAPRTTRPPRCSRATARWPRCATPRWPPAGPSTSCCRR